MSVEYTEQAVLFGGRRSLVGIVTRPIAAMRGNKPTVIILNTGIIHRVGHSRMYVTLARRLANTGRTVLRFDLSGIGDSYPRNDLLLPLKAALADLKEAIDMMQRDHGASRVVLVGLCSGADHAILYAHTDSRVVALVLMDPTLPPTAKYYLHYVAQRLNKLRNWISVATGKSGLMRLLLRQLRADVSPFQQELTLENLAFSPQLGRSYQRAMERGIRILAAFTSLSPRHTYRQQMLEAFPNVPFKDRLKLEFFPTSDHVFSALSDRSQLMRAITEWLAAEEAPAQRTEVAADAQHLVE